MPVTLMCAACGRTAPAGEDATTQRHWCKSCGTIMRMVFTKLCAGCHCDVTNAKRVKDAAGNYFCAACWELEAKRLAALQEAEAQALAAGELFACRVCKKAFPVEQVYAEADDQTICHACWDIIAQGGMSRTSASAFRPYSDAEHESSLPDGLEAVGDATLPDGLELVPPQPPQTQVFCENCFRVFSPHELVMGADGSVLCKPCREYRHGWPA